MRALRWSLVAFLLPLLVSPVSPASAQIHCRCECPVELVPCGNGFVRRQVCRRYCWREAPRYVAPPRPYYQPEFRSPVPQYAASHATSAPQLPQLSMPPLPDLPPELIGFLLIGGGVF